MSIMMQKGHCDKTGKDFEIPVQIFGEKKEIKCPECNVQVFDIGGVLYHVT